MAELHVISEIKRIDKKIDDHHHPYSEIVNAPTSLPANGGNADTVDGKHASDFATTKHAHTQGDLPSTLNAYTLDGSTSDAFIKYQQQLGPNVDLNTLVNSGRYWQPANANTSTALNYPTAKAGHLTVYGHSQMTFQVYHVYDNSGYWYRAYYQSWSAWQVCATGNELDSLKSSVSSGKTAIANAITGKGVAASGSDTHATLANKIGQIKTAREVSPSSGNNSYAGRFSLAMARIDTVPDGSTSYTIPIVGYFIYALSNISLKCDTVVYRMDYNAGSCVVVNPGTAFYLGNNSNLYDCILAPFGGTLSLGSTSYGNAQVRQSFAFK